MNKLLAIILPFSLFLVLSCDTSSNVKPRNADFFFKVYGGITEGDHLASSIIETSDGGLLIAGTSYLLGAPQEILLIKTDVAGNIEWQQGYSNYFGTAFTSEAKTLLEVANGFIVGGVLDDGNVKHSVLYLVDQNGIASTSDSIHINNSAFPDASYIMSSATIGPTGLLVAGTTDQELSAGFRGGENGFISLYEQDLSGSIINLEREIFGLGGDEEVIGAYEVSDPGKIGPNGSQYLVFGTTTGDQVNGNKNFFYTGFTSNFSQSPGIGPLTTIIDGSGNQSAKKLKENNGNYWMIGDTDNVNAYLIGWKFKRNSTEVDWEEIPNFRTISTSSVDEVGKSMAFGPQGMVILNDLVYSQDHTEISLASFGNDHNIDPGWPVTFGNTSSTYSAADVIVLQDGSIVTLGTADLEPIKKIVVIKTGPNGEMNFE